jgi:putative acetyltransferase
LYRQLLSIERLDFPSPEAQALIAELDNELHILYPEDGPDDYRLESLYAGADRGAFLVARQGSEDLGCCALLRIDKHTGELRRMYVRRYARNRGIGKELVRAIEIEAKELGITRLVLETGVRQPAAIALYTKMGFVEAAYWGISEDSPLSVYMIRNI